jgi:hypothetical protein
MDTDPDIYSLVTITNADRNQLMQMVVNQQKVIQTLKAKIQQLEGGKGASGISQDGVAVIFNSPVAKFDLAKMGARGIKLYAAAPNQLKKGEKVYIAMYHTARFETVNLDRKQLTEVQNIVGKENVKLLAITPGNPEVSAPAASNLSTGESVITLYGQFGNAGLFEFADNANLISYGKMKQW